MSENDKIPRKKRGISNNYTTTCPCVRGDNSRALASGISYVLVDERGKAIYTTYISIDLAHHEIVHANVGKDGINSTVL